MGNIYNKRCNPLYLLVFWLSRYNIKDMDIHFCKSCRYCKRVGDTCNIEDDMQAVYKDFYETDAVVFDSPIFVSQISGQMKTLYDRLYALYDGNLKPRFSSKKVVDTIVIAGYMEDKKAESMAHAFQAEKMLFE